jgi:hypothetical protein
MIAFEVYQQSFDIALAAAQSEFFAFAVRDLSHHRNEFSR